MNGLKSFKDRLKFVDENSFSDFSIDLFHFQLENNPVYQKYVRSLDINPESVEGPSEIPFMPISLFKYHKIKTLDWDPKFIFESSGTSGFRSSRHFIEDNNFYKDISSSIFTRIYGNPKDYIILALLPSYLERNNSSLVYMVNYLIELTGSEHSGFYLSNLSELYKKINFLQTSEVKKIMLWGVTFALLDFARNHALNMENMIIVETGGMKGRGEEIVRSDLHEQLFEKLKVSSIHSEYGMTELLSQAYAVDNGKFSCPPWMKVMAREINDPFCLVSAGQQGVLNIIDLANIHSCAFIATEDLGRVYYDGTFEVLGRLDNSDMRGCNLLLS
jgi:phenylacetate-coenzyme A ligase PaaK-like adenylate-forming protein